MNNSNKNSNPHATVQIPNYQILDTVYSGSRTLVYRAIRTHDQLPVAIKLLKNEYPTFSELVQFRNQYTIATNLNSPLIIKTYSLEPYQNCYALVLEDFAGISLKEWTLKRERTPSLIEVLEIAISLCNTLDILYRDRIIHKDIKPANILINPETKQVKLIDFSIASLLPRETQTLINPNVLEGTLAYISPEQTGRMNRGIDYRTDFYSLGVTFYELLTGKLPFQSNEPMELVHCHIAKATPLVHEIDPEIPSVLSEIVNKLMAKNAEERYQSALGLKFDLENCLHQLQISGEIQSFEIARRDVCDRFIIPDKLYGRETEVKTLLEAFERVSSRRSELMLVSGFSGIGKTAVVNEVHKPIVRQRGYFIKGKYDQFQRNIPFSAFVQAFRDLMGQLLTESDAEIQQWKNKILEAVGENGQVIIELIPQLERIIGQQPAVPELSGTAAQNRFNLLFQKFTQVFTSAAHPLVMFLDDLQWADLASLKLIELLMAETSHLFLIGAYRDNEVNPAHPLMLTLREIQTTQATINTITLAPLTQIKVNQLVADTFKCTENLALPLSKLIFHKTKGNPFFTAQFLKVLHQDGLIQFDFELGCWQCDIARVNQQALADDVVAFMALQLGKLPPSTQQVLQLAACMGNQFDLVSLAIVWEHSEVETASNLWRALQEGVILPISNFYKFYQQEERQESAVKSENSSKPIAKYCFLHDRVQQAAYSLIPEEQKQITHLKIGQLLLNNTPVTEQEQNLFEIVNQLNIGKSLIIDISQQIELAKLNLQAGKKARYATAYAAASEYSATGIALLNLPHSQQYSCWQINYDLTLALYEIATETAYLNGDFEQMEQWAYILMQQAKNAVDKMKVYAVKIQAYMAQVKKLEAVNIGLEALELVGISFPESPEPSNIQQALTQTATNLDGNKIEDLMNLPLMTDIEKLAATRMLASMAPPTYQATPALFPLVICELVNLSIKYGNSPFSSYGYACYGILLNAVFQDAESAYQFGKLASSLAEKFSDAEIKASVFLVVGGCTIHGKADIKETLPILLDGYQSGLESGNFEFAGYCAIHKCQHLYFIGQELTLVVRELATVSDALARLNQQNALAWNRIFQQSVLSLLNSSENTCNLEGEVYNEKISLPLLLDVNNRSELHYLYLNKLILSYLFGEYKQAHKNAGKAEQYLDAVQGLLVVPIFNFYDSLAHLAIYPSVPDSQQEHLLNRVMNNQEKMKQWATDAPMNFQHKFDLVAAEQYRILGNKADAMDYYDRAIALAKEHGYIQEEALANELAAKFYLDWGKQRIAQEYTIKAYYGYARWGAKAKVTDLERCYPQLLAPILQQTRSPLSTNETIFSLASVTSTSSATESSSSLSGALDLATILKASQTISGEIELEKLLCALLSIVIENAGADKCVLMLLRSDCLLIEGSITVGTEPVVLQRLLVEDSQDIPLKLIYKVKHDRQTAVLIDATADRTLANDPYIIRQQPKSILCSPILHQGKLMGVFYLENCLVTGAFTADRIELLNLLCAQAAISLENARLYEQVQQALENARFMQFSIDRVSTPVCWVEPDARISYANDAFCRDMGYSQEEVLTKYVYDINPEFSKDSWLNHWPIVKQQGTATFETRLCNREGIEYPVEVTINYIEFQGKEYHLTFVVNISDRKRAESAILQKSQELERALQDLQKAQIQIVQSEKMSALGNLVAGVAHEINNPVGFIAGNLQPALEYVKDTFGLLDLYQQEYPNPNAVIQEEIEAIDLEYIREDLPKLIGSMQLGVDRIRSISTSLRTFSRADKDYKVPFNIHEGIDSTILILKHRLKANEQRPVIEVVTNYGNLPQIECFPGQLNQVFVNLLANAIEALEESNVGRSFAEIKAQANRIIITTSIADRFVKIAIADNGKGMSEQVKSKIFEHLFTTKAVGKGTGLGLAIARQIVVEKHSGSIHVNSTLGRGTEFIITLPTQA